ncbi:MAG: globin family protein [Pseudomonadota bacterium]
MTPEQVKLVQDSFQKVVPIAPQAADIFYTRLFEIAPEVRPMFPEDMSEQGGKLMAMLGTAVGSLHQVDTIIPAVQDLGRKHVGYGVTNEQYKPVGEALIYTLEKGLGDDFTPDVKEAWVTTYTTLQGVMTAAADEVVAATPPAEKKGFFARMFG